MQRALLLFLVLFVCMLVWSAARPIAAQDAAEVDAAPDVAAEALQTRREKSPLPVEPKSPEQLFEAVVLLAEVGRPELAKIYLDKFLENLDDATLLKIRDARGPADFLRLSNIKELQPESIRLLNRANAVFVRATSDPARVERLIADLRGNPDARELALDQLRLAGVVAVPHLVAALGDATNDDIYEKLVYALVRIGTRGVPPLVAALDTPNARQRIAVIQALERIDSEEAIPYLWYAAADENEGPGVQQAARQALRHLLKQNEKTPVEFSTTGAPLHLKRLALEHFRAKHAWQTAPDGLVEMWSWDQPKQTVALERVTPTVASSKLALKFAREALDLSPANEEIQSVYLGVALADEVNTAGWNKPLPTGPSSAHDLALSVGPEVVSRVVTESLDQGSVASAVSGLIVLAQLGSPSQLQAKLGERAPLLVALNYPDFRVQFAAATAILQIDPPQPFAAARHVVDILGRAIADSGEGVRKAIVIDASGDRGSRLVGLLGELHYEATAVHTGREGFRLASSRADTDLIMIDANVIRWGLSETVANLQADARTAGIPLLIYGPEEVATKIRRMIAKKPVVRFMTEPGSSRELGDQLHPFLNSLQSPPSSPTERQAQAESAAYWLAYIAQGQREKIFDLTPIESAILPAVENPKLTQNVLIAMGAIPTRRSQRHLADVVLDRQMELEMRKLAATQLATHIQRHSLLIPDDVIRALNAAWKSETDADLHAALGAIVGSLKPNAELVGKRLRDYGRAPAPAGTSPGAP